MSEIGHVPGIPAILETLAGVASDEGCPSKAARLLGASSALRTDIGRAREPLDQAGYDCDVASIASKLSADEQEAAWHEGAGLNVEEACAYARRGRGRRGRPSTGWSSLTPTELEVVALVAESLTNREIGERLFISPRTVQTHLSHVFVKTGIRTRRALAKEMLERRTGLSNVV